MLGLAGFFICSNETLNTILYIKSREAENEGTKLNIQIKDEYAIMINDYDLCRLVSNIIDNSINATRNAKDKSQISISIEIDEKTLKINSKNKFSNKTNDHKNREHGNGIGIIKEIASKYNGTYSYEHNDEIWNTQTVLNNMPLSEKVH